MRRAVSARVPPNLVTVETIPCAPTPPGENDRTGRGRPSATIGPLRERSTMTEAVLTEERDGVLVISINRPEARNAINGDVARGIAAALDRLDDEDGLRVGVLTGSGGFFSSGMDLKGFLSGDVPIVEGRGLGGLTEKPPRKPSRRPRMPATTTAPSHSHCA